MDVGIAGGGVFTFGTARFLGSAGGTPLNAPVVGMATTPDGHGYWLVGADGGVFSFGDADFYGSTGAIHLNKPIVGMATTPDGHGYWLVAADGGVFSFGDADFYGSTGAIHLNKPIVGMATTPDGHGYWLVGADGGVFSFGDADFHGSTGAITLNKPIVGVATTPDGGGYWLVASDGGVFAFGDADFYGSVPGQGIVAPEAITSVVATADGHGLLDRGSGRCALLLRGCQLPRLTGRQQPLGTDCRRRHHIGRAGRCPAGGVPYWGTGRGCRPDRPEGHSHEVTAEAHQTLPTIGRMGAPSGMSIS